MAMMATTHASTKLPMDIGSDKDECRKKAGACSRNILFQNKDACRESSAERADCRADKQAGTLDEATVERGLGYATECGDGNRGDIPLFSLFPFMAVARRGSCRQCRGSR